MARYCKIYFGSHLVMFADMLLILIYAGLAIHKMASGDAAKLSSSESSDGPQVTLALHQASLVLGWGMHSGITFKQWEHSHGHKLSCILT